MKQSSESHQGIIPASPNPEKRQWRVKSYWLYMAGTVLLALMLKIVLLGIGAFPFNADEAVVGLMARHILQGKWPIFFYGQAYMGSLDASLVAFGFSLFGVGVGVIRGVQVLLYLGTVLSTMQLGWGIFGSKRTALIAGLLMAVPAVNVTLYTTVSLGGYGETLLIGNLLLLLGLRIANNPSTRWPYLAWGGLAGLGFWTFGLTLVYILPCGVMIGVLVFKKLPRGQAFIRLISVGISAVIGAAPWIAWAVIQGPTNMIQELSGSAIAGASPENYFTAIFGRLSSLLLLGSTVIWGIRPPWEVRWLALPLLPLALAFWLVVLTWGIFNLRLPGPERIGRRLLAGMASTLVAGFIFTSFGADPSGRYFVALSVPMALFAADILSGSGARIKAPWATVLLVGILGFNLWGTLESATRSPPGLTTQFDVVTQIDHSYDQELIEFLELQGETKGYTNYWVAYPLAFLSEERLIFVPILPYHLDFRYTKRYNRYIPYSHEVQASQRVAYITTNHAELDEEIRGKLRQQSVTWKEIRFGDYLVFYQLSRPLRPEEIGSRWLDS